MALSGLTYRVLRQAVLPKKVTSFTVSYSFLVDTNVATYDNLALQWHVLVPNHFLFSRLAESEQLTSIIQQVYNCQV